MSLYKEYINKVKQGFNLEEELISLIKKYNAFKKRYLLVYVAATNKNIPGVELEQSDYYVIHDMLRNVDKENGLDIYIETRGGSGEAADEIVTFLRNKYRSVDFVVAGEAKSAGTIIVLSGNEIWMTETGSLGPIDAQMHIGRSLMSAHDYKEWIEEKQKEAIQNNYLNPFDQTIIAQITPGEIRGVLIALDFAKVLVKKWLIKYKFAEWVETETKKTIVDDKYREAAAQNIVDSLVNHSKWFSHGRSIKINDLEEIGLKIKKIDEDKELADIVYKIQIVCRLLMDNSPIFKIFATEDSRLFRTAMKQNPIQSPVPIPQNVHVVEYEQPCTNCKKNIKIYFKFGKLNVPVIKDLEGRGYKEARKNLKIKCSCGTELDFTNVKNNVEQQSGRKVVLD